jgi:hypothetical protein
MAHGERHEQESAPQKVKNRSGTLPAVFFQVIVAISPSYPEREGHQTPCCNSFCWYENPSQIDHLVPSPEHVVSAVKLQAKPSEEVVKCSLLCHLSLVWCS